MSEIIGAMRARVRLESPSRVADEIGGAAIAWSNQGDVWAEISSGGVSDAANYDSVASRAAYRLAINRRADVRAGWRVIWGAREFRVAGVADDRAARIILFCEEERL